MRSLLALTHRMLTECRMSRDKLQSQLAEDTATLVKLGFIREMDAPPAEWVNAEDKTAQQLEEKPQLGETQREIRGQSGALNKFYGEKRILVCEYHNLARVW